MLVYEFLILSFSSADSMTATDTTTSDVYNLTPSTTTESTSTKSVLNCTSTPVGVPCVMAQLM